MKITERTGIRKLAKWNPSILPVFWKYGIFYVNQPFKTEETIKETCHMFGLDPKEFIKELEEAA